MRVRVRVFTLLASSALLVGGIVSLTPAASAGRSPSAAGRGHVFGGNLQPNGLGTVLYAQQSNDSGVGIVSQDFGDPGFDVYDAQGADDFTVPAGQTWTVKIVGVTGVYFNGFGPATTMNVTFYQDGGGTPGSVITTETNTPGSPKGPAGVMKLSSWVTLTSGTYWVSFQPGMNFTPGGEYGWETTNDLNGSPAVWVNPGNGFVTGCTTYQNMQNCIGALGEGPDFRFSIMGVSQPAGS
jgi:hypothetical protein